MTFGKDIYQRIQIHKQELNCKQRGALGLAVWHRTAGKYHRQSRDQLHCKN